MHNDLFTIGSITIHGYGFMIAMGVLTALFISFIRSKKLNIDSGPIVDITLCIVLSAIAGAKLLYIIVNFGEFIKNPISIITGGGFVVYGGIILSFVTVGAYCKIKKLDFLIYSDMALPAIFIGQGIGRIGCFLAGCCYGKPWEHGITFTQSQFAPNNIALFPTQPMMTILDILGGILLIILSRTWKPNKGVITSLYLVLYGIGRIFVEMFRGDAERGFILGISTSTFISFFIIMVGATMLVHKLGIAKCKNKKKEESVIDESKDQTLTDNS